MYNVKPLRSTSGTCEGIGDFAIVVLAVIFVAVATLDPNDDEVLLGIEFVIVFVVGGPGPVDLGPIPPIPGNDPG
ncbi:hypothetical protein DERF_010344 [Dermatophagoides farinae]|uniref:Uncharacterized protein n=1 Tax=Dermatophagoides farinae TaxID=6954 RepID=A0A922HX05_DERFA|nr:hypothetical protein DERF_010344 [Dermatophagoides farinae]